MRTCRHPSPYGYRRLLIADGEIKHMLFCKCDCGFWLSLDSANDTKRTAIEMRLADWISVYCSIQTASGYPIDEAEIDRVANSYALKRSCEQMESSK